MSDAFAPPSSEEPAELASSPRAPGELPSIGDLFNETIEDFTNDLAPYAMAGLAYFGATMLSVFVAVGILMFIVFGVGIGGTLVGTLALGEEGALLGSLLFMFAYFVGIFSIVVVLTGILAPMHASLERAIQEHIRGGTKLSVSSPFTTMTTDAPRVIITSFVVATLAMMGICVFYVGVFVAAFFLFWATSLVALDRKGPAEAISGSISRLTSDLGGAGALTAVTFLIAMVSGNLPVIGPMFGLAFKVRVHDALFPEA